MIDAELKKYATGRQSEYIDAINKHGSITEASRKLKITRSTIQSGIDAVTKKAAKHGYSPAHDMTKTVPDGFIVKGVSTYYNKEGKPSAQWVKSAIDRDRQEQIMREAFEAMASELPRLTKQPKTVKSTNKDLCNVFTLTDSHVGALSWNQECGADWDLKIAEEVLTGCFQKMVDASPSAGAAVVAQLGDFLHQDSIVPVTPSHGHILDSDSRYSKIIKVAIRILRRVIDMALSKHDKVIVLLAEGNHDISSSIWMRTMFAALYENEPRIHVIDSALPYYVYQHGEIMLSWHHGHLKSIDQLPMLFAAQFPVIWGTTKKRYCHTGHRHHVEEKEFSGMKVLQHSTLAVRDAYAARGGWMSEREVTAITYHNTFGQHSRVTITPEMLSL